MESVTPILVVLISVIGGVITGIVSGIIAPVVENWMHQRYQGKQQRRDYRVEQVTRWRQAIGRIDGLHYQDYLNSVEYAEMRPYLKAGLRESLDGPDNLIVGYGRQSVKNQLLDEIVRLEREWGLVEP